MTARALFVVSSGRAGSAMIQKLFEPVPGIDMHHEYMVYIVQKLACRYAMGLAGPDEACALLRETHGAAIAYCDAPIWGDSSNKLSWLIDPLARLFPEARFVHLLRDGRKVASSYFHKLAAEAYDDCSTGALARHLADASHVPAPPPEKKYWWPQPRVWDPAAPLWPDFDQFQRIVWHWAAINREIGVALDRLPARQVHRVRLEDLTTDRTTFERFVAFCGLGADAVDFAALERPHNVNRPEDRLLTAVQTDQFWRIASHQMDALGYAQTPEYAMRY